MCVETSCEDRERAPFKSTLSRWSQSVIRKAPLERRAHSLCRTTQRSTIGQAERDVAAELDEAQRDEIRQIGAFLLMFGSFLESKALRNARCVLRLFERVAFPPPHTVQSVAFLKTCAL